MVLGRGKRVRSPKCVVITGATAGIGEGLALHYAKPGVTLALTGRNGARLDAVAKACTERCVGVKSRPAPPEQQPHTLLPPVNSGAAVKKGKLNVTDKDGMAAFLLKVDADTPVECVWSCACPCLRLALGKCADAHAVPCLPLLASRSVVPASCVIANAGVSEETVGLERDVVGATRSLFATNVDGVFNTILPLIPAMKERRAGQIVIMSSLASTGPLPSGVAYSATKVAVRTYGEALRGLLYRDGVRVNVVCPGYVESDMTKANKFHMPGIMSMRAAVATITAGIAADVPVVIFPSWLATIFWAVARVFPADLAHKLMRRRIGLPPMFYLRGRRSAKSQ